MCVWHNIMYIITFNLICSYFCPEKFFQMKRSQCKDGLEIYKRFLTRMTRVSEFFKIAEVPCRAFTVAAHLCLLLMCHFFFSSAASGNRQKWHTWAHPGKTDRSFSIFYSFSVNFYLYYFAFVFWFHTNRACQWYLPTVLHVVWMSTISFFLLLCTPQLLLRDNNQTFTESCTKAIRCGSLVIDGPFCPPSLFTFRDAEWSLRLRVWVVSSAQS